MGLRPAKCYKSVNKPAYTRTAITVPKRNYIGTSPGNKIRQYNLGNPHKEFTHILDLQVMEKIQIRDNAIESSRTTLNRQFTNDLGKDTFFMKVRVYPHQILRENKQATGAGADRIQKGMSNPFGRPIGRAARTRVGQPIFSTLVDEENVEKARKIMLRIGNKLGCKVNVRVGTDVQSLGSKPKQVREIKEETKEAAEGEAKAETAEAAGEPAAETKDAKSGKGGKPEAKTAGKPDAKSGKTDAKKDAKK
ncbi:MAG: 50S ribosomal protein L16 [Candidatus Micrarchaeota archaeon]